MQPQPNQRFTGDCSFWQDSSVTIVRWTVGDVVRKLRGDRGLTQRQFAETAGIAVTSVNRLEQESDLSDQRTIKRAADALQVPVSLLYRYAEFTSLFAELNEPQQGLVLELMRDYAGRNRQSTEQSATADPGLIPESAAQEELRRRRG
jgi:transcriptional regulator with XRE-family HTH domain